MHKKKTHLPANTGSEIQSCVGVLNYISWGESLLKKSPKTSQDLSDL